MALEISTAGITLSYCVETTAGTKPTTGYTNIPNIKSIPDFNPTPSSLDVTDLSDTAYKRYIVGLTDVGGALAFGANITKAFANAWSTLVTAYTTGTATSLKTWFKISVPNFGDFYFTGIPTALGLPASEVDAVFEGDVYITPNTIEGWTIAA